MSIPVNDGYRVFTLLEEYSSLTGLPTGRTKPNVPSDPDYIPPVLDLAGCPLSGGPVTRDIIVEIGNGITVQIKLKYGGLILTRNTSGTWTVTDRTYDEVRFSVTGLVGITDYTMKVYYSGGERVATTSLLGETVLVGPFAGITKIQIFNSQLGDFNNDFNNDFNI